MHQQDEAQQVQGETKRWRRGWQRCSSLTAMHPRCSAAVLGGLLSKLGGQNRPSSPPLTRGCSSRRSYPPRLPARPQDIYPSREAIDFVTRYWRTHPPPHGVRVPSTKASAGFFGIVLSMHLCAQVDVYGFDFGSDHYYKKRRLVREAEAVGGGWWWWTALCEMNGSADAGEPYL